MHDALLKFFKKYPQTESPFMHQQLAEWRISRPLSGLRVLHHVPVVTNTLLKIACLIEAGAEVTVTHPSSFCQAHADAEFCLNDAGIHYVQDLSTLVREKFDLYFDCGAELYQALGRPNIGAIELTGSGDQYYRRQELDFPVVSVDQTLTKQLETVFGCAESCSAAIEQLTKVNSVTKSWLIFGFGKIGRGLAYFCIQNKVSVEVVEICEQQRLCAKKLGIKAVDPLNVDELKLAIAEADIVITATGKTAIMNDYSPEWFSGKILANLGIYDEYGPQFPETDVLNNKKAINFILDDPTPMKYIDPEFYVHNLAALSLTEERLADGVHGISAKLDKDIIENWCRHHDVAIDVINSWFTA